MAVAVTVNKRYNTFGGQIVEATLVFSGNYSTGGDTVSLAGKVALSKPPLWAIIGGVAGYSYGWVKGTTLANGKVRVGVNTGAGANLGLPEHTAAAYNAGVTADVVDAVFFFPTLVS
jgi:hypothetical protein